MKFDAETLKLIADIIFKAVKLGPNVIKTIDDAKPFAEIIVGTIGGKPPTPEKIAAAREKSDALSAEFQRPISDDPTGHDWKDTQGGE